MSSSIHTACTASSIMGMNIACWHYAHTRNKIIDSNMAYAAKLILEWQQSMNTSIGCFEQEKVNKPNKNKIVTLKNDNEKNKQWHVEKREREKEKKTREVSQV